MGYRKLLSDLMLRDSKTSRGPLRAGCQNKIQIFEAEKRFFNFRSRWSKNRFYPCFTAQSSKELYFAGQGRKSIDFRSKYDSRNASQYHKTIYWDIVQDQKSKFEAFMIEINDLELLMQMLKVTQGPEKSQKQENFTK